MNDKKRLNSYENFLRGYKDALAMGINPKTVAYSAGMETEKCFVYICGAVNTPGVYEVTQNARLYEVIEAIGSSWQVRFIRGAGYVLEGTA